MIEILLNQIKIIELLNYYVWNSGLKYLLLKNISYKVLEIDFNSSS